MSDSADRSDRYRKYDIPTRVGMLETDVNNQDEKFQRQIDEMHEIARRRWSRALAIAVPITVALIGGLFELVRAVH